jgi:hypothetical protein
MCFSRYLVSARAVFILAAAVNCGVHQHHMLFASHAAARSSIVGDFIADTVYITITRLRDLVADIFCGFTSSRRSLRQDRRHYQSPCLHSSITTS